jgi:hypothetical protein
MGKRLPRLQGHHYFGKRLAAERYVLAFNLLNFRLGGTLKTIRQAWRYLLHFNLRTTENRL